MKTKKLVTTQGYTKFALFAFALAAQTANAQQSPTTYSDQNKLIRAPQAVSRLGTDLFGDKVNLYNGALEFIQTDVSLPGNSALPVTVGRHIKVGEDWLNQTLFGRWDIEIPHLHGVFSLQKGWLTVSGSTARCSQFSAAPDATSPSASWSGTEYWHGSFLYVPGVGDQEMLKRNTSYTTAPTGNPSYTYPVVTRNNWAIRCLPSMAVGNGGAGEAFVAVSPDGTEYRFDWMVSRSLPPLRKASSAPELASAPTGDPSQGGIEPASGTIGSDSVISGGGGEESPMVSTSPQLSRVEIWILPTLITDRFGNTVSYSYDTTNKWQLKTIVANDAAGTARTITLSYETPGSTASNRVSSVTDGTRTWRYAYDSDGLLQTVTLPDNSAWQLGGIGSLLYGIQYLGDGSCDDPGYLSTTQMTGSMTHPSGAIGTFTLTGTRHGRAGVENNCKYDALTQTYHPTYPKNFDTFALTSKTLSGPGLSGLTWTTQYPPEQSSWAPCNGCSTTKVVSVTNPDGNIVRHTFGTLFRETEGQPQVTETVDTSGQVLRSTVLRYKYLGEYGYSLQPRGDGIMAARISENDRREITQQGTSFVWEVLGWGNFAQPTMVSRSSSLGHSRTEQTDYENNLAKWILGQAKKVTETSTGKVIQESTFDPVVSTVLSVRKFGKLQQSLTYYADGTIRTVADEKNPATTFSDYKRGIPRRIDYPDGKYETAVVDNLGKITSLTNEAFTTHTFGYDAMGRLYSVAFPQEPGLAYNTTYVTFSQMGSQEFDLTPGHWRQLVVTGTAVEANYYDALWRPVYTERWDDADRANTMRKVKHQYDFAGRTTYESYPKGDGGDVSTEGVYPQYDALGRPTTTTRISELGNLYESYSYQPGLVKLYTDAKGNAASYTYQAFDEPTEHAITQINVSAGVSVNIARDIFGKTTSITRSGSGVSATRSYVYDGYERLCKTVEPETGATIQDYDAANNVAWRASGLSLTATNACNTGDVPASKQIAYTYDARNRLLNTTYGDGSPAIYRTYTNDGLPNTIQSDGTLWTYGYNNRRLPTSETLNYGGVNYSIGRSYDANGSLSQLTYPDNFSVAYNPNALGEARQAGGYATGVYYHPNGAVKQFSYGNGIAHMLTQNLRGLPQLSQDGWVLNDLYTYDQNANVASITDQAEWVTTRNMEYDGLNRLTHVSAPALWGDAWYGYDALDNLTSSQVTAGAKARTLTHNINYGNNRLDSVTGSYTLGFQYDSQGNIILRGGQSYSFDIGNRMRSAPGITTHAYDGLGRRTSVVGTDGINHIYVYSQEGKLLYETTTGQALASGTKYVYLHRHLVAEVSGGGVVYDHTDGLGSPVAKTNATAGLISRTRYEPYGATAAGTEPTIGFTGHLNAANLGLVDMQQRFYDPVAGRFLSIDPVLTDANTGDSFNRYAYANNNPFKYVDPDGRGVESVTVKGNHVYIVIGMTYVGSISPEKIDKLNEAIMSKWSGSTGKYTLHTTVIPGAQAKYGNVVNVVKGEGQSEATNGGSSGKLYTKESNGASMEAAIQHEVGHFFGMNGWPVDKYHRGGRPFEGWEANIMAMPGGMVEDRNVDDIISYRRAYLNSGKGDNGKSTSQSGNSSSGPQGCMAPGGNCWQ